MTLSEWEHVADPFEKAAHYLEKALYKMLTQNIVPEVTATLRVRCRSLSPSLRPTDRAVSGSGEEETHGGSGGASEEVLAHRAEGK